MQKKELGIALTACNTVRKIIANAAEEAAFSPKEISFKSALRLIALFFLTGEAEYSAKSLQEDLENLLIQISRQTIPILSVFQFLHPRHTAGKNRLDRKH